MNPTSQNQPCLFCAIAAGKIPAFKVMEDSDTIAFLDINPSSPGHTLVIPKKHARDIFEIDEDSIQAVARMTKRVADKIRSVLGTDVSVLQNNGAAAGQAIGHLHAHVIPRLPGDRLPLAHMGPRATNEALTDMQKKLMSQTSPRESSMREALSDWDRL